MSFLTSHAFYRFAQIFGLMLLPAAVLALWLVRIEERFAVPGIVEAEQQVILRSPLKETLVKSLLVKTGQDVEVGAELIEFLDLANVRVELKRKQVQLTHLMKEHAAFEPLLKQGIESGTKVWRLKADIDVLEQDILVCQDLADRLVVRAPFAGRIIETFVKPHENVEIGTKLLSLANLNKKIIRCMVPERHASSMHPGQPVCIKSNLFNFLRYDIYRGQVLRLSPYPNTESGKVAYETFIAVTQANAPLKIGSTSLCEIITDKQPLCFLFMTEK